MKVLHALLLVILIQKVVAQTPAQVLQWINTVSCDKTNFYQEIPFVYRNNNIVIY